MRNLAELYLQFCHCQPLPLFDSKHFIATINAREVELRLCVAALALRFRVPDMSELGQQAQHVQWLRLARQLVMKHIIDGTVELSTLQSLCLLSLSEFNGTWKHIFHRTRITASRWQSAAIRHLSVFGYRASTSR